MSKLDEVMAAAEKAEAGDTGATRKGSVLGNIKLAVNGHPLGTLWVPSEKPKGMSAREFANIVRVLKGLADGKSAEALSKLVTISGHWVADGEESKSEDDLGW